MNEFPRMVTVDQEFPRPTIESIEAEIGTCFAFGPISTDALTGKRIAVTAGSRGIVNLAEIVRAVIDNLMRFGAEPFVVPAMGSHGGGTAEGQANILADYGITEETMGVPVVSSLETVLLGETEDGVPIYTSRDAYESDGILLLNRIKPHTDFTGGIESGLMKVVTIGLGKVEGAKTLHSRTTEFSYEHLITTIARKIIETGKIIGGLAILENAYHETAELELISPNKIEEREGELLLRAKRLMPSLPAERADALVIDWIGKNISGVGLDPNITGRRYRISHHWQDKPDITRIVVMDLTEQSTGNAVGIGLADFCSGRVVEKMDKRFTYLNAVTSRNTVCANIPIHFDTDRELLEQVMLSIGDVNAKTARLFRIRDTLSLTRIEASEALIPELEKHPQVTSISEPHDWNFDRDDNLRPLDP